MTQNREPGRRYLVVIRDRVTGVLNAPFEVYNLPHLKRLYNDMFRNAPEERRDEYQALCMGYIQDDPLKMVAYDVPQDVFVQEAD